MWYWKRNVRTRTAKILVIALMLSWTCVTEPGGGSGAGIASASTVTNPKSKVYRCEHISQETFIGDEDISDVILTDGVREVDDDAFLHLDNLRWIVVWGTEDYFSFYNCLYTKGGKELIYIPPHVGEIQIHNKLMTIHEHALDRAPKAAADKAVQVANQNWYRLYPTPKPTPSPTPEPTATPWPTPYVFSGCTLYEQMSEDQKSRLMKRLSFPKKKMKNFVKYCGFDKAENVFFHYYGEDDKVVYIPKGVQIIYGFSPDYWAHNESVESVWMVDYLARALYWQVFRPYKYGSDKGHYHPFYYCDNMKKVNLIKTKWWITKPELQVKKKGKVLYNCSKKLWEYGKRIALKS